jgi:hypothetical protein
MTAYLLHVGIQTRSVNSLCRSRLLSFTVSKAYLSTPWLGRIEHRCVTESQKLQIWDQCDHIVPQLVVHARRKSHLDCRLPILNTTEKTAVVFCVCRDVRSGAAGLAGTEIAHVAPISTGCSPNSRPSRSLLWSLQYSCSVGVRGARGG